MSENLKSKVVKGAFWNGLERFGTAFFLFVSNLVLARLLSPDDFGCIGMLMVFISISDAIVDGGFGAALVQKKNVTQEDYSTIFVWNILVSIFLYVLLFLCAPVIARFYNIESLSLILRVQGLVLLFNGFCIIQRSMLQKNLMFKKLAKVNISATIVGTLIGIICAFIGYGVWSLVVKLLFTSIMASVVLWVGANWKPKIMFDYNSFKSLFSFGSFMFLTSITNSIYQNTISLVIGKSISSASLGYFTQARKLEDIPRQTISSVVNNVSFPAFSAIQDNKDKMRDTFRKTNGILCFTNFSMTILLILIARPLIILLFSEKWVQSVQYFQVICLYGLIMSSMELNQQILKATGKSNLLFWTGVVRRLFAITLIVTGAFWGIKGILVGYVVAQYVSYAIVAYPMKELIGYSLLCQIKDVFPIFGVVTLVGILTYCICGLVNFTNNIAILMFVTFIFFTLLLTISQNAKLDGYIYIRNVILQKYVKTSNNRNSDIRK